MSSVGSPLRSLRTRLQEGPPAWLPTVAALLVAGACAALGRTTPTVDMALAAGLLAAAILAPPLGLVALVAGGLASPIMFATGTRTAVYLPAARGAGARRAVVRRGDLAA